jgi:hypothetical protein
MVALAIALIFVFSTNATAIAPSKPQDIQNFVEVTIPPDQVIRDYKIYPSPEARTDEINIEPKPIIVLTPIQPVGHSVQEARDYARSVLGATQYSCIDQIFIHESNWNPFDLNKSSGAYGIPQAVPGSKMSTAGADWRTNPVTQVKWGIHYVNGRYGSACSAWSFWKVHRWY